MKDIAERELLNETYNQIKNSFKTHIYISIEAVTAGQYANILGTVARFLK